ncbi:MAG: hypothetical protein U0984_19625 [Prosthecobacter sp.]|nr:hypothetical protein [Prosthecobacter sp.]
MLAAALLPSFSMAAKFDLGTRGEVELAVPSTWTATGDTVGDQGFNITLQPRQAAGVICKVTVLFFKPEQVVPEAEVQKRFTSLLERSTPPLFKRSGEIMKFHLKAGVGYYATLVEEKPVADKAVKAVTSGLVQLPNGCVATLTVFTDSKQSAELAEAVRIFESLSLIEKGRG